MLAARVVEPHKLLAAHVAAALREHGAEPLLRLREIKSKDYLHDEAGVLNDDELADARAALIEDGLLVPTIDLRVQTKYAWAIAHAARAAAEPPALWSVAEGAVPTTPDELGFIVGELKRRAIPVTAIDLCWPVGIEPAIDFAETPDAFLRLFASFVAKLRGAEMRLFISNAVGKFSVLPALLAERDHVLLDFAALGWMEAVRLLAREEPLLFRRALVAAQEHFAFDKPAGALSTSEDDIRTLPEVSDAELERVFLDDVRGRQLLHVTAQSVALELGDDLAAFLHRAEAPLGLAVGAAVARHLAA